jgi:hypothetical protein
VRPLPGTGGGHISRRPHGEVTRIGAGIAPERLGRTKRSLPSSSLRGGHNLGGVAAAAPPPGQQTPDPTRRGQRALGAAFANVQAGTFDAARILITTASDGPLDESQRATIDLLRAQLAFASSRGTEATTLLLAAAQRLEPLDGNLARETYLDAFAAALFGARLNDTIGVPETARAARAMPRHPEHEPTAADLMLQRLTSVVSH